MQDSSAYSKKRVLVVEDDERISETLRDVFIMGGYDVKTASNGREAIPIYKDYNPNIVITDIMMPEMDGIEMVKSLRKINENLKVIYVTAWFQKEDISKRLNEELKKYPHYRILKKPFKIESVWKTTEQYLAEKI